MNKFDERQQAIWGEQPPQTVSNICAYAQQFSDWALSLCEKVELDAKYKLPTTIIAVNQAKVLLVDKYQDYRNSVPQSHRDKIHKKHRCILQVFNETYARIRLVELSITPPLLFLPEPAPSPQQHQVKQVGGIYIAEDE